MKKFLFGYVLGSILSYYATEYIIKSEIIKSINFKRLERS